MKRLPFQCRLKRAVAFTLVELLAAMAVLIIMVAIFAQAVGGISSAWQSAQHRMDNYTKARAFLSSLQADVDGMVIRPDLVAFPNDGTSSDARLGFYTLRRGVGDTANDSRALSYVNYFLGTGDFRDRLLRNDLGFRASDIMKFSSVGATKVPGTANPATIPDPADAPGTTTGVSVGDGILDFRWAFLRQDGTFSPSFYYDGTDANGNTIKLSAIGIAVAVLVVDEKSAASLDNVGKLDSLIEGVRGLSVNPSNGDWSPKTKWDEELGLKVGSGNGSLVASIPQKRFLDGIRAFQRIYLFPNSNR